MNTREADARSSYTINFNYNYTIKDTTPDEATLVRQAIAGEEGALEILFAQHSRALFQTALRLLGNPEDAEDALQEAMLSAYRNLPRFEGRSQFSTWMTRIVINAALMRRRSKRAHPALSLDDSTEDKTPIAERFADGHPSPEQLYASAELSARVEENLQTLSPLLRNAFQLRELEGLTADEAARALGVSRNTLKARLWRARQQLAGRLGDVLRHGTRITQSTRQLAARLQPAAGIATGD
ncbi:MAG: RNA polymerase subunit sigma-24 [Acidobacteria bacterium]|nr:MAG: RNA polymerase subunit sigma-24 [Acidobacteriota bacterium]